MLRFHADNFVQISTMLTAIEEISEGMPTEQSKTALRQTSKDLVVKQLPRAQEICEEIGLAMSALLIKETVQTVDRFTYGSIGSRFREIRNRIRDELSLCLLLHVPTENREAYENPDPFGDKVTANFSSAAYDIEEASKCLALDRSTACVLHLMRVLETAIDAIALGVGVKVTAVKAVATWEQLLNMIRDAIQANNKANAPPWAAARPFFESAYAYLHAVKDAWRNPSVHAEQKYTSPEAQRVYTAIKNLMAHLADHLNELGEFSR